ncbi:IS3 family transposase [Bacteroides sp.]|uniref:IS3 family transposase n=1 Tax=Bacteroides sp. TaxID=29523 RepID=UPI0025881F03|nr:IS3 family transposase [Bacteroides sp.]
MSIHRSYFYYAKKKNDKEVIDSIIEASEFGNGLWKIYSRLRREGKKWNHKRVYRV